LGCFAGFTARRLGSDFYSRGNAIYSRGKDFTFSEEYSILIVMTNSPKGDGELTHGKENCDRRSQDSRCSVSDQ
jgi:hypothetical protein